MQYFPNITLCMLPVLQSALVIYLLALLYEETRQHGKVIFMTIYLLQNKVKLITELNYLQYNKTRGAYCSVVSTTRFLLQFW